MLYFGRGGLIDVPYCFCLTDEGEDRTMCLVLLDVRGMRSLQERKGLGGG